MLVVAIGWITLPAPAAAQFNGDFAIEAFELDDENFLDWKAYQSPHIWLYEWYRAKNAFRASVGSFSRSRFYFQHEIKLQADLGRYGAFLYTQQEEGFFRSNPIYQEAELRLGREFSASLVGWAEPDKRFNNIGGALAYGGRTDWDFVRVSYINQFAQYNQKNREGLKEPGHYEQTPVLERLEARTFWRERLFVQLDLKRETPAEFRDAEAGASRHHEGREIEATVDWWGAGRDWLLGLTYRGDEERRRQVPDDPSGALPGLSQTLELAWLDLYGWMRLSNQDQLTLGYLDSRFANRIQSDVAGARFRAELMTGQGYALWELSPGDRLHWLLSLQVGLADSETQRGSDPAQKGDQTGLQMKFGAGLVLAEAERYRFLFHSTWDLDLLAERAWDGGNVQVQIFF